MQSNLRLLALAAVSAVMLAGCSSTSPTYDAPPEPGQTTFSGPMTSYDAPPEPGQTTFTPAPTSNSIPEPGQTNFQ